MALEYSHLCKPKALRHIWFLAAAFICQSAIAPGFENSDPGLAPPAGKRWPLPATEHHDLSGFADFHAHMFSNLAFGGFLFAGEPFAPLPEPDAMLQALPPCVHTSFPHLITRLVVLGTPEPPHGPDGFPAFGIWPRAGTHVHQQMYLDWVYRAYQYGLRLLCIVATNSQTLCEFSHRTLSCNDMEAVDRQIEGVQRMADWVARNEGGWLEVAYSASDASRIIADNRLAVIMGVEVDTLFNCGESKICTEDVVRQSLEKYFAKGVRQITPVHLADSGFGGSAFYDERFQANHHYLRGDYQQPQDCGGQRVEWTLRGSKAIPLGAKLLSLLKRWRWYSPAVAPARGTCNRQGLTPLGRLLIREMMKRGMLIDLNHMSEQAVQDTLEIVAPSRYPVMLAHTWFRDLKLKRSELGGTPKFLQSHWNEQRAEMHASAETIAAVKRLGGVIGVLTDQGFVRAADESDPHHVLNDCDTSSKSFAQAFLYAIRQMGTAGGVGFGTDFNGLAGQIGPRFGKLACGGDYADPRTGDSQRAAQVERIKYDGSTIVNGRVLTLNHAGNRDFDFNFEGLAHYGLIPDLIADLQMVGVATNDLAVLFRSAGAYVNMWQHAEHSAHPSDQDIQSKSK